MTLNNKRSKAPHIHVTTPVTTTSQISVRFHSMASRFPDTGHFETSAQNDPKIDLKH